MSREVFQVGFREDDSGLYMPTDPELVLGGPAPHVSRKQFHTLAAELNESWGIHRDARTGQHFDIGVLNADKAHKGTVLVMMTSNGGFLINAGNSAEELAAAAASDVRRVIVNDFGVGGTDMFPLDELLYYAVTGRRTVGTGTPDHKYGSLESYQALYRVLNDRDLMPTHLTGNGEAASGVFGVAAALDENSLKGIFLNNPHGLKHDGKYNTPMVAIDTLDRFTARFGENDPWAITPELKAETELLLPKIYEGDNNSWIQGSHIRWPLNMAVHSLARIGRGRKNPRNPLRHAMIQDALATLDRHEVGISIHINTESKLNDIESAIECGRMIMNLIRVKDRSDIRQVNLQFSAGGHDRHTAKPHERWSDEWRAFAGTIVHMIASGGQSTGGGSAPGTTMPFKPAAEDARKEAS